MMRTALICAGLVWRVVGGIAGAEDVDHPSYVSWQAQPVGSMITMRSETDSNGHILTTTTTTTLKAMKPDKAVFAVQRTSNATGSEVVSAVEPYELIRKFPLFPGVKRDQIGKPTNALASGTETLTLAGRTWDAVWFDTKTKGDGGLDVFTRTWMADNAPGRLLKSVTRIPQAKTVVTVQLMTWTNPTEPGKPADAGAGGAAPAQ